MKKRNLLVGLCPTILIFAAISCGKNQNKAATPSDNETAGAQEAGEKPTAA